MNRVFQAAAMTAAVVLTCAAEAQAQWTTPLKGRVTLMVNGAGQNPGGDVDLEGNASFSLYDEQAVTARRQTIKGVGGAVVEGGLSFHLTRQFAVGLSYTSALEALGDAAISGSLPDPDIYDRPRSADLAVTGLRHRQSATHVSAIFTIPFVQKVDFAFTIGPTFVRVEQDIVQTPTLASFSDPLQSTVSLTGAQIVRRTKSAVGFNIGGEATYMFLRSVGAAAVLRYVRASVDLDVEDSQQVNLKAGNAQLGVGIRLKF